MNTKFLTIINHIFLLRKICLEGCLWKKYLEGYLMENLIYLKQHTRMISSLYLKMKKIFT